jgi:hypothetical protein
MQDTFTFGPSGKGSFRMRFAYHEIQYITITGLGTKPALVDVTGLRLTSLGKRTGDFVCSNALTTQIYTTTVNNYRGLTTGGMTVDCPHRERKGYGGDGHTSYQVSGSGGGSGGGGGDLRLWRVTMHVADICIGTDLCSDFDFECGSEVM